MTPTRNYIHNERQEKHHDSNEDDRKKKKIEAAAAAAAAAKSSPASYIIMGKFSRNTTLASLSASEKQKQRRRLGGRLLMGGIYSLIGLSAIVGYAMVSTHSTTSVVQQQQQQQSSSRTEARRDTESTEASRQIIIRNQAADAGADAPNHRQEPGRQRNDENNKNKNNRSNSNSNNNSSSNNNNNNNFDDTPIIMDHTTVLTTRPKQPITIAYAVSLIKCGDFQSTEAGLVDAAIVLRHSIHETSSRATTSHSHYDYKMYAIVHPQAESCSQTLADLGFAILIRPPPVQVNEISDPHLRKHIHKEWCCGADEFIKLHAYTLPEPVVVHLDIDFVMHKPMDTLLDVLLYDKESEIGRTARTKLEVERTQSADEVIVLPDRPQAAMTRDWGQTIPGYRAFFQAGFIAARTNPQVLQDVSHIIKTEKYSSEIGKTGGWGGLGYGSFVGAMAMQGLMAFYYDQHAAGEWIELNVCQYNHMGMDARMRGEPNFIAKHRGKCRNNGNYCEDCMVTPVEHIYNIHYTQCRKPWMCIGEGNAAIMRKKPRDRTKLEKALIPVKSVHVDHCLALAKIWHGHRSNLETRLAALTGDPTIAHGRNGTYMVDHFDGHCAELGPAGYLPLAGHRENLKRVTELYGD